jgi:hypothetical protein
MTIAASTYSYYPDTGEPSRPFNALSIALYLKEENAGNTSGIEEQHNLRTTSLAAVNNNIKNTNNKLVIETLRAFALSVNGPVSAGTYDCVKFYSLTIERLPLLEIEDNEDITKLVHDNRDNDLVLPSNEVSKLDGNTTTYRRDTPDNR